MEFQFFQRNVILVFAYLMVCVVCIHKIGLKIARKPFKWENTTNETRTLQQRKYFLRNYANF